MGRTDRAATNGSAVKSRMNLLGCLKEFQRRLLIYAKDNASWRTLSASFFKNRQNLLEKIKHM